jgi:hypothetical protein
MLTIDDIKYLGADIAGYMPLHKQHGRFHSSSTDFRWLFGGNQSGKSYTNMMDLSMVLMDVHPVRKHPEPTTFWAGIESWEQVRDILWLGYLQDMIPRQHILGIDYGQDRVPRKVLVSTGHTLEFKAFNQGRTLFQGRKIGGFYGDEQCHRDFMGILNEVEARLLVLEGFISWSMTPIKPQPELEERILSEPDTDSIFYADLNYNRRSQGGYISDKRIDDMISEWPEETRMTRVAGKFASFYGAVYKGFSRKIHAIKPFPIPETWRKYRAIDFGFTNPFVCLWLAQDGDENWYVYNEYYQSKTGMQTHISNINARSAGQEFIGTYADPEDADNRNELRKAGIPTIIARKDIARGIEVVQNKLEVKANGVPSLRIFNTCKNLLREFPGYQYPTSTAHKNASDVPINKNNHALDALRYGIYTVTKPRKKGRVGSSTRAA